MRLDFEVSPSWPVSGLELRVLGCDGKWQAGPLTAEEKHHGRGKIAVLGPV